MRGLPTRRAFEELRLGEAVDRRAQVADPHGRTAKSHLELADVSALQLDRIQMIAKIVAELPNETERIRPRYGQGIGSI